MFAKLSETIRGSRDFWSEWYGTNKTKLNFKERIQSRIFSSVIVPKFNLELGMNVLFIQIGSYKIILIHYL